MGLFADTVTLVNRTPETRSCKWDGIDYTLPPGETANCPRDVALAAILQNKQMGSQHPNNPSHFVSLFGIKGDKKWPCTPLQQSTKPEVIDRSKLAPYAQAVAVIDVGAATDFDARETALDMMADILHAAD
jgi:hypothetical protein